MFRFLILVQFSFVIYGVPRVTRDERGSLYYTHGLPHVPRDDIILISLTLCILLDSSFLFNTLNLGWSIE